MRTHFAKPLLFLVCPRMCLLLTGMCDGAADQTKSGFQT